MNLQLHRKQIFMLILAMVLAIASYFIPQPQQPTHSLTKPDSPELREAAPEQTSGIALSKWRR